jgi:hypothetical protein
MFTAMAQPYRFTAVGLAELPTASLLRDFARRNRRRRAAKLNDDPRAERGMFFPASRRACGEAVAVARRN